jgi:hypothetical protein
MPTLNECVVTVRPSDDSLLFFGRSHDVWPTRIAWSLFAPGLQAQTPLAGVHGLPSPTCEGSLVTGHNGRLYFSNPSSTVWRGNLSVHSSADGLTWDAGRVVWGAASGHPTNAGYSSLLPRDRGLALLFEGGDAPFPVSWPDTWVRFTWLPYA